MLFRSPRYYVPSLQSLCLKTLAEYPNQLYRLDAGLDLRHRYIPASGKGEHDLLRELIPTYDHLASKKDSLKRVDPRLWATLIQTCKGLPETFRSYELPLEDLHLPLLQDIPSTSQFTMVTTLALSKCDELHDDSVAELGRLHGLVALDISHTIVSSWGVKRLTKTLLKQPPSEFSSLQMSGPWGLRILSLRECMNVDNEAIPSLVQFPLLSVVGEVMSFRVLKSTY